jgi:hypothetical protein
VVDVETDFNSLSLQESLHPGDSLEDGQQISRRLAPLVTINGGYFKVDEGGVWRPQGYYFANGFHTGFNVIEHDDSDKDDAKHFKTKLPVLGIDGWSAGQGVRIVEKSNDFMNTPDDWHMVGTNPSFPIWDDNHNGRTDVSYALQAGPMLVQNGKLGDDVDAFYYVARTALGIRSDGHFFMVVADGEGVTGSLGASTHDLAAFFRDVLHADNAMNIDGGGSSQMWLRSGSDFMLVNTLTCECNVTSIDARVLNYVMVHHVE